MFGDQSLYVSRFYEMDPTFDDLVAGPDLRDGMVVLIEDHLMRGDVDRATGSSDQHAASYEMARVRENNRWCTVTRLTHRGELVHFVGEYADGTKAPRTYNEAYYWLVKRASMTEVAS